MEKRKETNLDKQYLVKERSEKDIKTHGSVDSAIQYLETQLEEMESLWSLYSSDCLGHGITCTRLKIRWLNDSVSEQITIN